MEAAKPKAKRKQQRKTDITKKTKPKQPVKAKAKSKQPVKTRTSTKTANSNLRKTLENPGDIVPDIPSVEVDFCGVELTALRYSFLRYYLIPGQPCFHNAYRSALKAGYSESTAKVESYSILREPNIQKIINANDKLTNLSLHEAAIQAIELKKQRAFYDPIDYFEEREIKMKTKDGDTYIKKGIGLKSLENMTPEQRLCIDGMDMKGQASIPVYLMPNREKELNDIIKMEADMLKSLGDNGEEETREIIMERIRIREIKRAKVPADLENEIVEGPVMTDNDTEKAHFIF
jgi:hypothetical protein